MPRAPRAIGDATDGKFLDHWRQELLDRAWEALAEVEGQGARPLHMVLAWRVANPEAPVSCLAKLLTRDQGKEYTDANARQWIHRAREKFAELLLEEIACSLANPSPDGLQPEVIELGLLPYCRRALERRKS